MSVLVVLGVITAGCSSEPGNEATSPTSVEVSANSHSQSPSPPDVSECKASPSQVGSLPASLDMGDHPYLWAGDGQFAAVLFYSHDGTSTLRLAPGQNGPGREGKFLWLVANADAMNGPLTIIGTSLVPGQSFTQQIPGGGSYPSIVTIPSPGCWTMTGWLQGRRVGSLVVPIV